MAELGDPFTSSDPATTIDKIHVTDRMMDFSYVKEAENIDELKAILCILKSAENKGQFRILEQAVERKILELLPEKERRRIVSMSMEPTMAEVVDVKESLGAWLDFVKSNHYRAYDISGPSALLDGATECKIPLMVNPTQKKNSKYLPPVRISLLPRGKKEESKNGNIHGDCCSLRQKCQTLRIISKESMSNSDYFAAWEKFDVDEAEHAIDDEDRHEYDESNALDTASKEKFRRTKLRHESDLSTLRVKLKVQGFTNTERATFSERERRKGNEYYRCGEHEEAIACYSKSIAFNGSNAIVYSNRAMAAIRLSYMEQALSDTTMALELEPSCVKARARRGAVHHQCGRYGDAMDDFERCVQLEPENRHYALLLRRSEEKMIQSQGDQRHERTKISIAIQDTAISSRHKNGATNKNTGAIETRIVENGDGLDPLATSSYVKSCFSCNSEHHRVATNASSSCGLKEEGNAALIGKKFDDAVRIYTLAIHSDPKSCALRNNRALAYLKLEKWELAEKDASIALEAEPTNVKALYRRGHARVKQQTLECLLQARMDFKSILAMEPQNELVQRELRNCEDIIEDDGVNMDVLITKKEDDSSTSTETHNTVSESFPLENVQQLHKKPFLLSKLPPQDFAEKYSADIRTSTKKVLSSQQSCSTERMNAHQPLTATEFELVIRSFRFENDEKLIAYLQRLKKSCYKKVLTETISPETLAMILHAIDKLFFRDPKSALDIMMEIAKRAKALYLTYMCLDEASKSCVDRILVLTENTIAGDDATRLKHLLTCWYVK